MTPLQAPLPREGARVFYEDSPASAGRTPRSAGRRPSPIAGSATSAASWASTRAPRPPTSAPRKSRPAWPARPRSPRIPARPRDVSNNLGRLLISTGRDREAEDAFRKARDLYEGLANELPDRPEPRLGLASASLEQPGEHVLALGRYDEALRLHRQALEIREGLAARHPGRPDFRQDLAPQLREPRQPPRRPGEAPGGGGTVPLCRALKIRQELLGSSGDNPRIRQSLADGYNNLGDLLSRSGPSAEAEQPSARRLSWRRAWRPTTPPSRAPATPWPVST